jgi:release factor glutamine methyltransferase
MGMSRGEGVPGMTVPSAPPPTAKAPGNSSQTTRPTITERLRAAGCVFAEEEARLLAGAATTPEHLEALVGERVSGLPLEHLLGWAEFCGLRIRVDPGVFVPRRRTELLVREAARLLAGSVGTGRAPVVVDLCCGSGAVGAALAELAGPLELHASDVDPAAVRCAVRNIVPRGGEVHQGNLYGPLPGRLRGRVDVLAVNAPYVPSAEIGTMPQEARLHEPRLSLDGGEDGLQVQRLVAAGAPQWLAPGGHLLIETSRRQAPQTMDLFLRSGLTARVASSGKLDATVVIGTPAPGLGP